MSSIKRTIKCLLLLCLIAMFTGTGCAEAKRARIIRSTKVDSCDLSEMGKNRYFYSNHYKKRIAHSTRKLHRKSYFR